MSQPPGTKRPSGFKLEEPELGNNLIKRSVSAAAIIIASLAYEYTGHAQQPSAQNTRKNDAVIQLGARLFQDERFSTPKGDLPASCSHCHMFDESGQGIRARADFLNRSWVSYRAQDPRREELRNSPTLLDVSQMPRLHYDGEFGSLEELVKGTLSGRTMGWLPGEEQDAFDRIQRVILTDKSPEGSYRDQFKRAYGISVDTISRADLIETVAKAISDFTRTLNSNRATPYDKFLEANGLESEPRRSESPAEYAGRLITRIAALEAAGKIRLTAGFDAAALSGFKIFLSSNASAHSGNCASCHAPPLFTDFSFHNTGVSQSEYESVHGEGSFALLKIPNAGEAARPSQRFRETPSARKTGCADLGYWNFVDLKSSPLRRAGETDDHFLERMIGTFKTPTLRNLAYTNPYMHNGGFASLEDALEELARLAAQAREGLIRSADPELVGIRISQEDIAPLTAFLNTLNQDLRKN